jgi:hypothetical protein
VYLQGTSLNSKRRDEPMMTNHDTNHDTNLTKDILRYISQAIYYRYSLTDEQVQNLILRHATVSFSHRRCEFRLPKKFQIANHEFLDYELLSMRAKHVKQFQTAPSEVERCRF